MTTPQVQYIKTSDRYDIACFVAGQGRTLVRVPFPWTHISRLWSPDLGGRQFDAEAEHFRLVQYDGRGQGLSTRGLPDSLSLADYVHDLEAVVDSLGTDRFILGGMSSSAIVAIQYAVEHPERVEALVLWNYSDLHASVTFPGMFEILEHDWQQYVETLARMGFPELDPQHIEPVMFDTMTQADHLRQIQVFYGVSGEDLLARVRVPTLFMAARSGSRPAAHGATEPQARRWCAMLPGARLVLFDDARGGLSTLDGTTPPYVLAIEQFLRDIGAGDTLNIPHASSNLSTRELEVLRLLAAGRSNPQIAEALVISSSTVAKHVTSIFTKTGTANRVEASAFAHRRHVV